MVSCAGEQPDPPGVATHSEWVAPVELPAPDSGPVSAVSVATMDRTARRYATALLPVEARMLILSADGDEPELDAIRSMLDFRGVPYDVFVASEEPPLTASRLHAGARGFYQATILTSSSLAIAQTSALDAEEWAALADFEATFRVRRAVLAAWPDPDLGFGPATEKNTSIDPLEVDCTDAGPAVFRDVNCAVAQMIAGDTAYLSVPAAGAPLTPLLTDAAGHALAAIHRGGDGRQSLLLLFRNHPKRLHSLLFLHGVLGWVSGGTYLGERRIDLSAQLDDLFFASDLWGGGTYRIDEDDLKAGLAWMNSHRSQPSTPDFRVAHAFNGKGAEEGDGLTEEVKAQSGEWHWINHTYRHARLDDIPYVPAYEEYTLNIQVAGQLPLLGFDVRNLVTPDVSGLVNSEAMQAATDVGIRFAVTDTSREGCDNPSPNTTFYNEIAPSILLIPRRPTGLYYNVSTPAQWVDEYNHLNADDWGYDSTYPQVIDRQSEALLHRLMRGDADPWMFHQSNLRAYDGVHSLLGDLVDATLAKLAAHLRVPVRTPPMDEIGLRFARRLDYDAAGVRATLFRGRALVIDVARAVSVPVTGVRSADGEAYGGDVIGLIDAVPGTSTCVPLDGAGDGCDPPPVRVGGPGPATDLPTGLCNASSLPQPDAGPGPDSPDAAGSVDAASVGPDATRPPVEGDGGGCGVASAGALPDALLLIVAVMLRRARRRGSVSRPITTSSCSP